MRYESVDKDGDYSVGDKVLYKNHLREYKGDECSGKIIGILKTYDKVNQIGTYFIINDKGRIRSVHKSSICHKIT